jgi:hypothetical protein
MPPRPITHYMLLDDILGEKKQAFINVLFSGRCEANQQILEGKTERMSLKEGYGTCVVG